jgi:hypothetical protein
VPDSGAWRSRYFESLVSIAATALSMRAGGLTQLATLNNKPTLTAADFFVICSLSTPHGLE